MRKGVIYKLVFPNGETYIGRTVNLQRRLSMYRRLECKQLLLLYDALIKYGYKLMDISVVERDIYENELNNREIYWIEFYKTMLSKYPQNKGLNICAGGAGSLHRKDTFERIEQKRQMLLNNPIHIYDREMSKEEKIKLSERMKGHKYRLGSTWSESQRVKFKEYAKTHDFRHSIGRKQTKEEKEKQIEAQKILLLNTETGIYYNGFKEAANSININNKTFQKYLENPPKTKNIKLPFIKLSAKKRSLSA